MAEYNMLKEIMNKPLVLSLLNMVQPFYLYTDVSREDFGTALMQNEDNRELKTVSFASQIPTKT